MFILDLLNDSARELPARFSARVGLSGEVQLASEGGCAQSAISWIDAFFKILSQFAQFNVGFRVFSCIRNSDTTE